MTQVSLGLLTMEGRVEMCSFITKHNGTDVTSVEGACKLACRLHPHRRKPSPNVKNLAGRPILTTTDHRPDSSPVRAADPKSFCTTETVVITFNGTTEKCLYRSILVYNVPQTKLSESLDINTGACTIIP